MKIQNTKHHITKTGSIKKNPTKSTLILVDDGKKDNFGRQIYRGLYSGNIFVDVDGVVHSSIKGEPNAPVRRQIIFMNNRY
jgi:hypothetical protein